MRNVMADIGIGLHRIPTLNNIYTIKFRVYF